MRSLRSPIFSATQPNCQLQMSIHQSGMFGSSYRVVVEPLATGHRQQQSVVPWVPSEVGGNDYNTWETNRYRIGRISQDFQIVFEVVVDHDNMLDQGVRVGHVAIDDLQMHDCFPDVAHNETCQLAQVRCTRQRLDMCLRTVKVCDVDVDCDGGEDEALNCAKMPAGARCDFEADWCGWSNAGPLLMKWTRHSGPTPTEKTGPESDHTLQSARNGTGHYLFVNMNQHNGAVEQSRVGFASNAVMNSAVFNPPPAVCFNATSAYTNSCMVRFYAHQFGPNLGSVNLSVVELGERENVTTTLWWSTRSLGEDWLRVNVILPAIVGR